MKYRENPNVYKFLGGNGRMIGAVKWAYRQENPGDLICFNANICTLNEKIWYGDLNISKDEAELKKLSQILGEKLYIFREHDARFEKENTFNIAEALLIIDGNQSYLREDYGYSYQRVDGFIKEKKE